MYLSLMTGLLEHGTALAPGRISHFVLLRDIFRYQLPVGHGFYYFYLCLPSDSVQHELQH